MLQKILVLAATAAMAPALLAQTSKTELKTPAGRFPLEVTAEYLGMAAGKTVVRIRLSSAELSKAAASKGIRAFSGELRGTFSRGSDMVQAFRYPVSGDIMEGKTFTYSFLRPIAPGNYRLKLVIAEPGGREVGEGAVDLMVPEVGLAFRPEMAPSEAETLPEAEAIVIADEAAPREMGERETDSPRLKLLPPPREAPVGLLRLEAQIEPPITKVAFYLGEKLLLARTRPPYSVEIDLGNLPLRQTVRAVGYDDTGKVIDEDAWAINEGAARVAVRVLPQPDPSAGKVRVRVAVQSIAGGIAKLVELFLDDPLRPVFPRQLPSRDRGLRGRSRSERHPDAERPLDDRRKRSGRRRAASRFGARQERPFRERAHARGLLHPGGRPRPVDLGLRGRRQASAHHRSRRRRLRLDGKGPAFRARSVSGAVQEPDPRKRPRLRHRIPGAAALRAGPDGKLG
jgi:hypothetical protein